MGMLVDSWTEKDVLTDNGALTNSTSHNFNLDLFFIAGACRNESTENIENTLVKSWATDRVNTLKIIYWAGDIRGGAGERRFFKLALNWLYKNHKEDFYQYLNYDPEFSRWDVLFQFAEDEKVLDYICENVKQGNALLCKWLPRKVKTVDKYVNEKKDGNTTVKVTKTKRRMVKDGIASKVRARLGWTPKRYRKHLVNHTNVVEQKMCAKKWSEIDYSKVPSVAMNKYSKAWIRNDKERFEQYLKEVNEGKSKINASAIFPHDILGNAWETRSMSDSKVTQWNNLPNYMTGENSILPICDVSASMTWQNNALAMRISVALGLYLSERNNGIFKDAFITFSTNPQMQYLKGNINERIRQLMNHDWCGSTNIEAVFHILLQKAVLNHIPENEMPKTVLIISDMEFDYGTDGLTMTANEQIHKMYRDAGYNCPNIVYWNVNGRVNNVPVTMNNSGVALISGASPSIIKAVLGNDVDPINCMNRVIQSDRYSFIK